MLICSTYVFCLKWEKYIGKVGTTSGITLFSRIIEVIGAQSLVHPV
jgi:hypothetical protein